MPNRTGYNSRLLRDSGPAAPAPRTRAIGVVHEYWIEQAKIRQKRKRARAQARKLTSLTNK